MRYTITEKGKSAICEALRDFCLNFVQRSDLNTSVETIVKAINDGTHDSVKMSFAIDLSADFVDFARALIKAYEKYPVVEP
jgi:hypothetical protein